MQNNNQEEYDYEDIDFNCFNAVNSLLNNKDFIEYSYLKLILLYSQEDSIIELVNKYIDEHEDDYY